MNILNKQKAMMLTTSEVAEYLRISSASVYRLVKNREMPVSKIGRQLRFRGDAINKWLSKKENEMLSDKRKLT